MMNRIPVLLGLMLSLRLCPVVIISYHFSSIFMWCKAKAGVLKGILVFSSLCEVGMISVFFDLVVLAFLFVCLLMY